MTAIVTGAAQGIGAAIARRLAADGYRVAVCDLKTDLANEVAKEIGGVGFHLDVSIAGGHAFLLEEITAEIGEVTALVNAAGVCMTQPVGSSTPEDWEKTMAINLIGPFFLMRACAESMKQGGRKGSIVNVASVSGFLPKLEQIEYGASKAALVSATRSLALVYGPFGIRFNAIAPGVIDTPMTQANAERRSKIRGVSPEEALAPLIAQIPLGRIGLAEEVAAAAAFLVSEEASYVNGQTLDVCGGSLMR